jgi:hypothetical protein
MKKITLLLLLTTLCITARAQEIDYFWVKGVKCNIPPVHPLPVEYKSFTVEARIDSLLRFFEPADYKLCLGTVQSLFPIGECKRSKETGDFTVKVFIDGFKLVNQRIAKRPIRSSPGKYGYVKEYYYKLPVHLQVVKKDGTLFDDIVIQHPNAVYSFVYGPNHNKIEGTADWNANDCFNTVEQLNAVINANQQKSFLTQKVKEKLWQVMEVDARRVFECLYKGEAKFGYTPYFNVVKGKNRQHDYADLDTAHAAFVRGVHLYKLNAANAPAYEPEFRKALAICKALYSGTEPRVGSALRNALKFNIASIYYHLGQPDEAKKYAVDYKPVQTVPTSLDGVPGRADDDLQLDFYEKYFGFRARLASQTGGPVWVLDNLPSW